MSKSELATICAEQEEQIEKQASLIGKLMQEIAIITAEDTPDTSIAPRDGADFMEAKQ